MWQRSCQQVKDHDAVIADKDPQIEHLHARIVEFEALAGLPCASRERPRVSAVLELSARLKIPSCQSESRECFSIGIINR